MAFTAADLLRTLLFFAIAGMAVAGVAFLRTRRLSLAQLIAWGLLALLVPLLGPFLVIALRPGAPQPAHQPSKGPPYEA